MGSACASIPKPIRPRVLLEIDAALRASVRLVPAPDPVKRRDRALELERKPLELLDPRLGQPVQEGLKSGRCAQASLRGQPGLAPSGKAPQPKPFIRHSPAGDGVIQFHAVAAEDRLDEESQSPVRVPGDFGPVTAFGTFKPIGPAHANCWSVIYKKGAPNRVRPNTHGKSYSSSRSAFGNHDQQPKSPAGVCLEA